MKKGTKEKATVTGATVLGAFGGAILNNLVSAYVGKPKVEGAPTQKEMLTKGVVQLVLAGAGVAGLVYIEGDDFGSNVAKGASATAAGLGTLSALTSFATATPKINEKLMADTPTAKVLRSTMGLACPCSNNVIKRVDPYALNRPKRRRQLGYPASENEIIYPINNEGSALY